MTTYWQVWTEGYHVEPDCEGTPAPATFHGHWPGKTFADACQAWAESLPINDRKLFCHGHTLTYWGCQLFDNEADARKSFG